jgi:hypothetical protein
VDRLWSRLRDKVSSAIEHDRIDKANSIKVFQGKEMSETEINGWVLKPKSFIVQLLNFLRAGSLYLILFLLPFQYPILITRFAFKESRFFEERSITHTLLVIDADIPD